MSDHIQLDPGAPPWRGSADATPGEVFDFYDMPLVGVLGQYGSDFVFQCLEGAVAAGSIWLYAHVAPAELDELKRLDGDEFGQLLGTIMTSRDVTIAVAGDDRIISIGMIEVGATMTSGLTNAIRRWLTHVVTVETGVASTL